MTIGSRIAALRRERGYAQEYLAERLGVSRQAVSKWETDQTSPDTQNLIALAELLGTSVEYLAMGKREETASPAAPPYVLSLRKVIGLILLSIGLLSLVLGMLLSAVLLMLAAYLTVSGVLCLTVRRHLGLAIGWATYLITLVPVSMMTGVSLGAIFSGGFWFDLMNVRFASLFVPVMWAWLIALVAVSAVRVVRWRRTKK